MSDGAERGWVYTVSPFITVETLCIGSTEADIAAGGACETLDGICCAEESESLVSVEMDICGDGEREVGVWKIGGFKPDGVSWESLASSGGDSRRVPTMPMSRDDDFVWEVVRDLREYFACAEEDERTTAVGETVEGGEGVRPVRGEKGMSCKGTRFESGGPTSAEPADCASTSDPRLLNGNVAVAMLGADNGK